MKKTALILFAILLFIPAFAQRDRAPRPVRHPKGVPMFYEVLDGDTLIVRKAKYKTMIAHVGEKAFYDIVYEKLGDGR